MAWREVGVTKANKEVTMMFKKKAEWKKFELLDFH